MIRLRTSDPGRTFHVFAGWSALPSTEFAVFRQAVLSSPGRIDMALASELLALIDQEETVPPPK